MVFHRMFFLFLALISFRAFSFCGFYVAKADASLYNKASQIILVRDGDKTAITMFSDYKGEMKDFALVIPVPSVLTKEQVNVGDRAQVERVDAFSAPRLVEYFDEDPCNPMKWRIMEGAKSRAALPMAAMGQAATKSLGVTIEAQYTIGEYDILILSAKESTGLETWLTQSGYKVPKLASKALEPYVKQKMKFFVAKVNLTEQIKSGFTYLRPIQFAFESPKFMLPLRLGMANADGPQDMLVYAITRKGRVETTNYRTVKLPTGMNIPEHVKGKFADFYRAMFEVAHEKENKRVVFLEYAWNMAWCDPCAAQPLTNEELKKVGVFWVEEQTPKLRGRPFIPIVQQPPQVFLTRLHVRYDAEHFPEDLFFQETADTENFQGRYVLQHPWTGELKCSAGDKYKEDLKVRQRKEGETLSSLTGWKLSDIMKEIGAPIVEQNEDPKKWYQNIFK